MLRPPRQSLDQDAYLRRVTGQNTEIENGRVTCPLFKEPCVCLSSRSEEGLCSPYTAMSKSQFPSSRYSHESPETLDPQSEDFANWGRRL